MVVRQEDGAQQSGPFPPVERDTLRAVASELSAAYPWVEAVYLFGSRARGCPRPGSEVDLAVLPCLSVSLPDRRLAEAKVARFVEDRLGLPVDMVLVHCDLSPGLLFDIFSVETVLHARDEERAHRVACQARAEYRELRPRRERGFARLRQQIEERADALKRP
jgi:predicted nucleotidyltransferase